MRKRLNLFALAVVAAGGAVLARPDALRATYFDPRLLLQSCCEATGPFGATIYRCCSMSGCIVTANGCAPLR